MENLLAHFTFVSGTKIQALTPVFLDVGTKFYFGASTRRFIVREKYEAKVEKEEESKEGEKKESVAKPILPEDEEELDVGFL